MTIAPSYANVSVTQLGGGSAAWTSPRDTRAIGRPRPWWRV